MEEPQKQWLIAGLGLILSAELSLSIATVSLGFTAIWEQSCKMFPFPYDLKELVKILEPRCNILLFLPYKISQVQMNGAFAC